LPASEPPVIRESDWIASNVCHYNGGVQKEDVAHVKLPCTSKKPRIADTFFVPSCLLRIPFERRLFAAFAFCLPTVFSSLP